ncbi:MAG TPA: hypothetical protein VMV92_40880 [Streptosporangiaceae bacterium]|nr:hypothetical protein [Streptosporangiaceae bacterium]
MSLLEARVLGAALGLALIAVGLALAVNFRGVTEWHIRKSYESVAWLERIPPWSWQPRRPVEQRIAGYVMLERAAGVLFSGFGVLMLIIAAVAHLTKSS